MSAGTYAKVTVLLRRKFLPRLEPWAASRGLRSTAASGQILEAELAGFASTKAIAIDEAKSTSGYYDGVGTSRLSSELQKKIIRLSRTGLNGIQIAARMKI